MKNALKNKLFLITFLSDMISNFGDSLYYLALMNYVLQLPDSKFAIALITLSETIPMLTSFITGIMADRTRDKVGAIMWTLYLRVALYLVVGVVMGFTPALWIVVVAIVVNLLSDFSGQYESNLFSPISIRIIPHEEREGVMAFRQATSSVLRIGFQASGAILIGIMSYQVLAVVNAGTFLVSALLLLMIRPHLNKLLAENPIKVEKAREDQSFIKGMGVSLKESWEIMTGIPILKSSILTIMILNAVGASLDIIAVTTIKDFEDFIIVNPATTLAVISILFFIGNIVGSLCCTTLFKHFDLKHMITATIVTLVGVFIGFFYHNSYVTVLLIFASAVIVSGVNPKFIAMLYREIPEEKLGTIGSGIDSFMSIGMLVSKVVLSGLVVMLSAQQISLIYLLISIALLVYTMIKQYVIK